MGCSELPYELSLQLLRSGGLIAIDNVLLFGSVIDMSLLSETLQKVLSVDDVEYVVYGRWYYASL